MSKNNTTADDAVKQPDESAQFSRKPMPKMPEIATRDAELIARVAHDLKALYQAIVDGDAAAAAALYPRLHKLPVEAVRIQQTARRAMRRSG